MTTNSALKRAGEARALTIALAVAAKAGWQLERAGLVLPAPYDAFFYVAAADLLVVPTSLPLPEARHIAEGGTREARADALIVSCADQTPKFAIGIWSSQSTHWHLPVRPWLSNRDLLWMAGLACESEAGFAKTSVTFPCRRGRLMPSIVPWTTTAERLTGQLRAAGWLGRLR